jgi:hypothetical protein
LAMKFLLLMKKDKRSKIPFFLFLFPFFHSFYFSLFIPSLSTLSLRSPSNYLWHLVRISYSRPHGLASPASRHSPLCRPHRSTAAASPPHGLTRATSRRPSHGLACAVSRRPSRLVRARPSTSGITLAPDASAPARRRVHAPAP